MRQRQFLRHRYRAMAAYTGGLVMMIGFIQLAPLLLLPAFPEESAAAPWFLAPGLGLVLIGLITWRRLAPAQTLSLTTQEASVMVVVTWLIAMLVGGVPFLQLRYMDLSRAVFEATSGWTTTGLTVVDVLAAPRLVLAYRSLLQWAGGAGFAIIMLSAIAGPAGAGLSAAEGRPDQLAPHVRRSAKLVLSIYAGYFVFGFVALMLVGMQWFDAMNHSFTGVATGGFSTRPESIGYWDSFAVEGVIIVLMLLGSLNFLTAYTLLQGNLAAVVRNGELIVVRTLVPLAAIVLFAGVTAEVFGVSLKAARVALFEAVSALSGTGFTTTTYAAWAGLGWLISIALMTTGGGAGSTAGGLKQFRVYVLARGLIWEFRRLFLPRGAVTEPDFWHGEHRVFISDTRVRQVGLFVFLYLLVYLAGSGATMAHGFSFRDSLFEFASALGTVGLSAGVITVEAPRTLLWTHTAGMFLGRLEFFAVALGVVKLARDVRAMLGRDEAAAGRG